MAVSISIAITQNSQSVANNTSNVTVKVTAKWTNGSYNALVNAEGIPQAKGWVKIDGTSYDFASTFNTGKTSSGSQTIFTKTVNVAHASDGKKTLNCSASYNTYVSSGTVTASASKVLTTIPRKSTLSVGNGTLGTSLTLGVTRQATSFTHTITYTCGSATGTICTKSTNTSISWTPPLSLASQNTAGTGVSIKYTITTYSGSTNVGSNSYSKSCTIPSTVKPSCTIAITDPTGIYDKYGAFVQGLSKFKVTVTPTKAYGSDIKTYKTTANGLTYSTASFTTGVLSSSGSLKVSATVTDKRGRSGTASVSKTVLAYSIPSVKKLSVSRCSQNGDPNDKGEFVQVTFSASVSSLGNKNTAKYVLKYKKTSEDSYTEITFDGSNDVADYTNVYSVTDAAYIFPASSSSSYDVEFDVIDNHTSTKRATTASTGFTLMHFGVTGDCIGIGKIAELIDVLDIGLKTRFTGGLLYSELEPETDLDDVRIPGFYIGENVTTYKYANCPITAGTFTLEVLSGGSNGQVYQRLTKCDKTQLVVHHRFWYQNSWGAWL